ncbi:MAG: PHP domain-containing protein, partial [Candidatus Shikimatogenerans sp. JK-2022]|nr:PHP domain-containing protein [Candidatus Shikimatogenerans bostrichidophilus]
FNFINQINLINKKKKIITGIIGCEINIKNKKKKKFTHVLIAKNIIGYYNLIKISTNSFIKTNNENYVKKKIIKKYKKGLIFLTGTLNSEISYYLKNKKIKKAKKKILYWKNIFKDDIYIEIFFNKLKYEKKINKYLLYFSKKYKILYINQYETFFLNKKDYIYHDLLLCIKYKNTILTPKNKYNQNKKGYRYGSQNNSFYFKNYLKIKKKYKKYKKGFYNLKYLLKKIKSIKFKKKNLLPNNFNISNKFFKKNKNKKNINYLYLKYLTYNGAKKKYGILKKKIIKRIKIELKLIKKNHFTNYFLIVKDIINKAKKLKIKVGPGRGS